MYNALRQLHGHSIAYMQEIHPVNRSDDRFYMFGTIDEIPDCLIAVDHKTGGSWIWCSKHNFLFGLHETCQICRDSDVQQALDAVVTACNTT
jgi:hypothetical protein